MNAKEFLELLLPPTGWFFTATQIQGGGWANTSHRSIDEAVAHVNTLTFANKQAYFALASYAEERVWDASWTNPAGDIVGKYRQRTQDNTHSIKSLFLDLDVDPNDEKKFASKHEALQELKAFVKRIGMPRPMVVDSGGGIHAYWPLNMPVLTTAWRPVADKFKAICLNERFRADRSLTSDQARVLRCVGGYNFKRGAPVRVLSLSGGSHELDDFDARFDQYLASNNIIAPRAPLPSLPGAPADAFGDNLGITNDPLALGPISFACGQIGLQVGCRGANTGEKLWRAALGIVKFCEPQAPAYRAISDGHAEYSEQATQTKIVNWRTGPPLCTHFHMENPGTCEACPHWGTISSPAQLGRVIVESVPTEVVIVDEEGAETIIIIPPTPAGYTRNQKDGVKAISEDDEDVLTYIDVCPNDLYPMRILRQHGEDHMIEERSTWRAHLPRIGAVDIEIPQALLADPRRLGGHMNSKGVYLNTPNAPLLANYMSAYLRVLAEQADRERMYEHLGWHSDNTSFVLGDKVLHRDGTSTPHKLNRTIQAITKEGIRSGGTLEDWKAAMAFYNRPGYEGHRFFIYASFGAPLFHMNDTGNKGVVLAASGESGRGKTTCLMTMASVWGVPGSLIMNGNKDGSTVNALYESLGAYHSLPFLLDDTTERDPEEMRRFYLNNPQGKGKVRMRGHEMSEKSATWNTMTATSTNVDVITSMMSSGKDVDPHLMRIVNVNFGPIDTSAEAKIVADRFLRQINSNYGHAGPTFMRFVATHYESVVRGFVKNVAMVDRALNSANASAERYWSSAVAAAYTGAQIAAKLGLLDYPYEDDLKWMVAHLGAQRDAIQESSTQPNDVLAEFLNMHVGHTLAVSSKQSSNLDNVVLHPHLSLLIRHELDTGTIFIARNAIMQYCARHRIAFRKVEQNLELRGVLLHRNVQKVLAADVPKYPGGQIRAWKIDATKLELPLLLAGLQADAK